jgi:hypothetical protein
VIRLHAELDPDAETLFLSEARAVDILHQARLPETSLCEQKYFEIFDTYYLSNL